MYKNYVLTRRRLWLLSIMGILIGAIGVVIARILVSAIAFFTHLFYFQKVSIAEVELVHLTPNGWNILPRKHENLPH